MGHGEEHVDHQEQKVSMNWILFGDHCWVFALGQASSRSPTRTSLVMLGSAFSSCYLGVTSGLERLCTGHCSRPGMTTLLLVQFHSHFCEESRKGSLFSLLCLDGDGLGGYVWAAECFVLI